MFIGSHISYLSGTSPTATQSITCVSIADASKRHICDSLRAQRTRHVGELEVRSLSRRRSNAMVASSRLRGYAKPPVAGSPSHGVVLYLVGKGGQLPTDDPATYCYSREA